MRQQINIKLFENKFYSVKRSNTITDRISYMDVQNIPPTALSSSIPTIGCNIFIKIYFNIITMNLLNNLELHFYLLI